MPVLLALALRYILIAIMQIGVFSVAQELLDTALTYIRGVLIRDEGMTPEEADESIAVEILSFAGGIGASAVFIKSRLPLRWLDKILKAKKPPAIRPSGTTSNLVSAQQLKTPVGKDKFSRQAVKVFGLSFIGSIPWWPNLVQQFMDQGVFNATQTNRVMDALGVPKRFRWPTTPKTLQPGSYTAGEFLELFEQLKAAGAVGINATYAGQSQLFTTENLSELINYVVGTAIIKGEKSDKTAVKKALNEFVITKSTPVSTTTTKNATAPTEVSAVTTKSIPQIQIYTGVLSQGTLGITQEFIARPDDMIQDVQELKAAIKNNLAPYITSLLGTFWYEIGIQNTYRTKGGFTVKGEPVKIISGYYTNGNPRYKTIYHKFAIMKLGLVDENGRNIKLRTIVLGPVNAVDFQPTRQELEAVQGSINPELFTNNVNDIKEIIAPSGVDISTSQPVNPNPPTQTLASSQVTNTTEKESGKSVFKSSNVSFEIPAGRSMFISINAEGQQPVVYARSGDIVRSLSLQELVPVYTRGGNTFFKDDNNIEHQITGAAIIWNEAIRRWERLSGIKYLSLPQQNIADVHAAFGRGKLSSLPNQLTGFSGPNAFKDFSEFLEASITGGDIDITESAITVNNEARDAKTLSEFYRAIEKGLPSLEERATFYQNLGLGPKSTYSGTAEQNNRLLAVLKTM